MLDRNGPNTVKKIGKNCYQAPPSSNINNRNRTIQTSNNRRTPFRADLNVDKKSYLMSVYPDGNGPDKNLI